MTENLVAVKDLMAYFHRKGRHPRHPACIFSHYNKCISSVVDVLLLSFVRCFDRPGVRQATQNSAQFYILLCLMHGDFYKVLSIRMLL